MPEHPHHQPLSIDALAASWWLAYEAAQAAVQRAGSSLGGEVTTHARRLAQERDDVVRTLQEIDRDLRAHSPLVRWLATPAAGSSLLGLPNDIDACVFDLDGVLTTSASVHAAAWAQTFDAFLVERAAGGHDELVAFDGRRDYQRYLASQPRLVGARAFLASRGIVLDPGSANDPPGTQTLYGLANRKNELLQRHLGHEGVSAFTGSRSYLEGARMLRLRRGVVSASASTGRILADAGLADLVEASIDAQAIEAEQLDPMPAPDTLIAACSRLGVEPGRSAIFETTPVGIAAARAAGAALVIAVDRDRHTPELRESGADRVVRDLGELFGHRAR
jgi:beta-phosphoglucomutase-like phosphatase (HAD superfamily)